MIHYEAPNPYPENDSWIFTLLRSLFPFSLFFLPAVKVNGGANRVMEWHVPEALTKNNLGKVYYANRLNIDGGYIKTHDGALLNTIALTPKNTAHQPEHKKFFIVKFNEYACPYESKVSEYASDAVHLNTTVIGFNYRCDKKLDTNNLIIDGIAQIKRLLDNGADSKKITIDGFSSGGAIATMVASYFHQRKIPISLWNDRSFASLNTIETLAFKVESQSSAYNLMKLMGEKADVAKAYLKIPKDYKGYVVVAKPSQASVGDGVIDHYSSLHYYVNSTEKRCGIKTGHKVLADIFYGHDQPRMQLMSKENPQTDAQELFEQFILRNR